MTGDEARLPFALLYSLRSHAVRQPTLTLLTLLAIATSVALAVALQMSSTSVRTELERTTDSLTGASQIEVTAGQVGIAESLLHTVEGVAGVLSASPVIQATVRHASGLLNGTPLHLLGVDLLADREIRSYSVVSRDLRILDAPMLMASVDSVIISEVLARRLGIHELDAIAVRFPRGIHRLVVRGILAAGGVADAYGGQVAVMDVYSLQQILGREGWVDRIDVVIDPAHPADAVAAEIERKLAGRATVRPSAQRRSYARTAMSTLGLAAGVFALVGILVASLLSYAVVSVSVDRRIREFAVLRAAGLEASRVRRLVYLDSLGVAALGTALGLPAGAWLSRVFILVLSGTSSFLQDTRIEAAPFNLVTLAVGSGVGLAVSLLGAVAPARRASRPPPIDVLTSERALDRGPDRGRGGDLRLGTGCALVWLALWGIPLPLPALVRTGALFGLGLVTTMALSGSMLTLVLGPGRRWLERAVRGVGRLAGGSLRMRPNHTRVAVGSIAGLVAALSSVLIILDSLAFTIDRSSRTTGEILLSASDPFVSLQTELLTPNTVRSVSETPGVRSVFENFITETLFLGERIVLRAYTSAVAAEHGTIPLIEGGDPATVARRMAAGGVIASEAFVRHFGLGIGDPVTLDTPKGPRRFPIVGTAPCYISGVTGSLRMDLQVFDSLWPRDGATNLLLWTDSPADPVLARIQERAGDEQALFFVRSQQLRRFMADLIARYSQPLDLLMGLTLILGGISVLNLLIGSVAERRRDLALLRAGGATGRQILLLVMVDGLIVALLGSLSGLALGLACSIQMREILTESFGWSLAYRVSPVEIGLVTGGMILACTLAGLYPGWRARGTPAAQALASE